MNPSRFRNLSVIGAAAVALVLLVWSPSRFGFFAGASLITAGVSAFGIHLISRGIQRFRQGWSKSDENAIWQGGFASTWAVFTAAGFLFAEQLSMVALGILLFGVLVWLIGRVFGHARA